MASKPTERRNAKESTMELDLTPMMNLIAILIPCLLVSVAFVEVAAIEVVAPGDDSGGDAPELSLSVTVTERGYLLAEAGGALARLTGSAGPELIPTVEATLACDRYRDTAPPPRGRNAGVRCPAGGAPATRTFVVYDQPFLVARLAALKALAPRARGITISAEPGVELEAVVDVMDASRETVDAAGRRVPLFDQVFIRPSAW